MKSYTTDNTAPEHLSDRAKGLWRDVVPSRCKSPGRLALLVVALEALDRADMARDAIAVGGMTTKTERTGMVHLNPLLKVEREGRALFAKLWCQMSLEWSPFVDGRVETI